ncbi:hypothetical protein F2Q70_00003763 [Brassica cretica]|uniref:Uncharacterized protein n=1 Tax=Brassica cretica TaxID=69181 RepID=A0A8S9IRB9_BRACR|nr:hypothetical protein F2Q70_00003763 [Brassica cretica]
MTSRHTRSNAQGPLFTLNNKELARLERQNRQQLQPTNIRMDDHGGQDDLTAAMVLMQQHMQQMQQTINTHEAAREAAAELVAQKVEQQGAPIGERNLPRNFPTTRSAINPPPALDSSFNKNKENDRSKTVNSIDDLAAKVDQLIKGDQSQMFIMEETASENSATDVTPDVENTMDNQQEVSYVTGQG